MESNIWDVIVLLAACGEARLRVKLRLPKVPPFTKTPAEPPTAPRPLLFNDAVLELNACAWTATDTD